jgi:hypothetical protein
MHYLFEIENTPCNETARNSPIRLCINYNSKTSPSDPLLHAYLDTYILGLLIVKTLPCACLTFEIA